MANAMKANMPTSKAGKAKNRKWQSKERFACGHDAACMALLPAIDSVTAPERYAQRRRVGVWRADTFAMNREDKIKMDAEYLLNTGRAFDAADAFQKASKQIKRSILDPEYQGRGNVSTNPLRY